MILEGFPANEVGVTRLDKFLEAMFKQDVPRAVIRPGEPVVLHLSEQRVQSLDKMRLSTKQLQALLDESLPAHHADELEFLEECDYEHEAQRGRVRLHAERDAGGVTLLELKILEVFDNAEPDYLADAGAPSDFSEAAGFAPESSEPSDDWVQAHHDGPSGLGDEPWVEAGPLEEVTAEPELALESPSQPELARPAMSGIVSRETHGRNRQAPSPVVEEETPELAEPESEPALVLDVPASVAMPAANPAAPSAASPTDSTPDSTSPGVMTILKPDIDRPMPYAPPEADLPIDRLFRTMVTQDCSDLHLSSGNPPLYRKDGEMTQLHNVPPLTPEQVTSLLLPIMPDKNYVEFREKWDTDFAYALEGVGRFRCNVFMDRLGPGAVFRLIPDEILTAEQLNLSDRLLDLCFLTKGLVVVTGPTGSGKSTTLAAMIDYINRKRTSHIITIEDPIEFVHPNKKCLINQREIGVHTKSFKNALRAALREDPDIVLVGEMRDLETIAIAIETAETGHLVFGTLHTNTAASTVDRIIDQFPADRQAQIRTMLSESLKAVIAQTLCKKIGGGRAAAMEVLLCNHAVSNLIREGKTYQLQSIMETGKTHGMVTLNDALLDLVRSKKVAPEEAFMKAIDKNSFRTVLQRNGIELRLHD